MATESLGELTVDLVANTASFEKGMDKAERALKRSTKEAKYQAEQLDKLIGQIDPLVAAYSRLDRQEEQLRKHRKSGRLNEEDFALYLKKLGEQREALHKNDIAYGKNVISAKQLAFATRNLPAQFTDIAVALQAGQNPLTILLQQGGQIKDMFGGIGPAAKALGGYIAGLVNPYTVAAAAATALAIAYEQGAAESEAFKNAIIISGNAAGVSADQLSTMAQSIDEVVGTQAKAAEVLAEITQSGKFASNEILKVAQASIEWEQATGTAASETIKQFERLQEAPAKASEELNKQYHYLTASVYAQIAALEKQGDTIKAAKLASDAYADALAQRSGEIEQNLGAIEKAWKGVKDAAKEAWDAALNVGREKTLEQQRDDLLAQIKAIDEAAKNVPSGPNAQDRLVFGNLNQQQKAQLQESLSLIEKQITARDKQAKQAGESAKVQQDAIEAQKALNQALADASTPAEKLQKRIAEIYKQVEAARKAGVGYTQDQINQLIQAAKDQYTQKDGKSGGGSYRDDAGQRYLQSLREQYAVLQAQADTTQKIGGAQQDLIKWEQQLSELKTKGTLTAEQKELLASSDLITAQLNKNAALEREIALRKQAFEDAKKFASFQDQLNKQLSIAQQGYGLELSGIGQGSQARDRIRDQIRLQQEYTNQLAELQAQYNQGQVSPELYGKETNALREALSQRLQLQQDYYRQLDIAQGDWVNGAKDAFADYATSAKSAADQSYNVISNALTSLEDALVDFVATGKLSFKDLANSILRDLARVEIKQLLGSVSSSLQGADYTSSIGNFLGSFFGGGRATGGPVTGGKIYEVNERGMPELFSTGGRQFLLPAENGKVTPMVPGGAGSPTVHQTFTYVIQNADMNTIKQSRSQTMADARRAVLIGGARNG